MNIISPDRNDGYNIKMSVRDKMKTHGGLQNHHKFIDDKKKDLIKTLFSKNPAIRAELVSESVRNPLSLVDLADIPDMVSDYELLSLISCMLDDTFLDEKRNNTDRTNKFISADNQEEQEIKVTPELVRIISQKMIRAEKELLKSGYEQRHFDEVKKHFPCDDDNNIIFRNQSDLISFLRKDPIRGLSKDPSKTNFTQIKKIAVICAWIKQMIRYHDFKKEKATIYHGREQLEKFTRTSFIEGMTREINDESREVIKDKSDIRYFDDKIFSVGHDMLSKYGVEYHHDIKLKIQYRAKTDQSVQDKLMMDPRISTAALLHDQGGTKEIVLGDNQEKIEKEEMIMLYVRFLQYASRVQKYTNVGYTISPSNEDDRQFMEGNKYADNMMIIEGFLNMMTISGSYDDRVPVIKDSGVLIHRDAKNKKYYMNRASMSQLGIKDQRFIHMLTRLVEQANKKHKKQEIEKNRDRNNDKKTVLSSILPSNLSEEEKETVWEIVKNIKSRKSAIEKIKGVVVTDEQGEYTQGNTSTYQYKKDTLSNISIIKNGYEFARNDITKYSEDFLKKREVDSEKRIAEKKKSHKGNYTVAKNSSKVYMAKGERFALESQVTSEKNMKNLLDIDDHLLFGPSKKLLVWGRNNSGILSESDIEKIVDIYVMRRMEALGDDFKCQNFKTLGELKKSIVANDLLAPVGATFREKILHNFRHERGLTKVDNIYLTPYYYNLQAHGLTPE